MYHCIKKEWDIINLLGFLRKFFLILLGAFWKCSPLSSQGNYWWPCVLGPQQTFQIPMSGCSSPRKKTRQKLMEGRRATELRQFCMKSFRAHSFQIHTSKILDKDTGRRIISRANLRDKQSNKNIDPNGKRCSIHHIMHVQIGWVGERNAGIQRQVNICPPNDHGHFLWFPYAGRLILTLSSEVWLLLLRPFLKKTIIDKLKWSY